MASRSRGDRRTCCGLRSRRRRRRRRQVTCARRQKKTLKPERRRNASRRQGRAVREATGAPCGVQGVCGPGAAEFGGGAAPSKVRTPPSPTRCAGCRAARDAVPAAPAGACRWGSVGAFRLHLFHFVSFCFIFDFCKINGARLRQCFLHHILFSVLPCSAYGVHYVAHDGIVSGAIVRELIKNRVWHVMPVICSRGAMPGFV